MAFFLNIAFEYAIWYLNFYSKDKEDEFLLFPFFPPWVRPYELNGQSQVLLQVNINRKYPGTPELPEPLHGGRIQLCRLLIQVF